MSISITETNYDIYSQLGYTPLVDNAVITGFSGATPSQSIIDAVEALPGTSIALWNVDITSDEAALALQALVTGEQWTAFLTWHNLQYRSAVNTVLQSSEIHVCMCCAVIDSTGMSAVRSAAEAALAAVGITRYPWNAQS